jgi:hypothetical protein
MYDYHSRSHSPRFPILARAVGRSSAVSPLLPAERCHKRRNDDAGTVSLEHPPPPHIPGRETTIEVARSSPSTEFRFTPFKECGDAFQVVFCFARERELVGAPFGVFQVKAGAK